MTRRRRAETQAETRRCLLDAAEALFEEKGFHGASVAEIAARAGYTTGAIYSNFERKEDLAVEVLDRSGEASFLLLLEALESAEHFGDRLVEVVRWRRRLLEGRKALTVLRLDLWMLSRRDPELRRELIAGRHRLRARFAALVTQQAEDAGSVLRVPARRLAIALLSAADGSSTAEALGGDGLEADSFAWTLAHLMIGAMDPAPLEGAAFDDLVDRMIAAATD